MRRVLLSFLLGLEGKARICKTSVKEEALLLEQDAQFFRIENLKGESPGGREATVTPVTQPVHLFPRG